MKSALETVSVLGAGAMGAVYASKFYDMDKNCVSLVAEGQRYERLKENGLIVNNVHYSIPVVRPEDEAPPSDLIIVALKHHHLPQGIHDIRKRVGANSLMLSVMNGIDSEEQIGTVYGMDKVLYTVAVGIDAMRQENIVTYTTQGRLLFGEAKNSTLSKRVRQVQSFLDRAGIAHETPEDMIRMLWWKYMVNVGVNQASAVLRAPYSVFQRSQEARGLMESAMREVISLAKAAGVHLSEEDLEEWYSVLSGLGPEGKTSMLQDIEARRKTEVEMFAGRVVELGHIYGIPTPVNETLLSIIKVTEQYRE
jgi:2-dehydropantoate 2-reductase